MPNPLVEQGTLNRLRASVLFPSFPALNITSPYLGREGIRLTLEGEATGYYGTMTGSVSSPQPYQMVSCTFNLIKSQAFADLFKQQFENSTLLGLATIRPDAQPLSPYSIRNFVLESVGQLDFSGEVPTFAVNGKGYYLINNALWNF